MFSIPQSTSFVHVFKAYLSSDHVTEATGKTIAITISKAGGAFGNPNAGATNATEISSGWYKVTLDTTDTGTLGIIAIRGAAATIDDFGDRLLVVSATTGGLTNLDAAISSRMATYTQPTGFLAATFPSGTIANTTNITSITGNITGNLSGSVGSVTGLTASNLDAAVSSRMATYTQPTGFLAATFPGGTIANTTNITSITGNITGNLIGTVSTLTTYTGNTPQTGDAFARIGAPVGASISADIAAVAPATWDVTLSSHLTALTTGAALNAAGSSGDPWATALPGVYGAGTAGNIVSSIKGKTDSLTFTTAGKVDSNIKAVNNVTVNGNGAGTPWGP